MVNNLQSLSGRMPQLQLVSKLSGGHDDIVWQARWSPSGDYLATCSTDRSVCIWRRPSELSDKWQIVSKLTGVHTRTIRSIAWSPCGRMIASAGFDATVCVWRRDDSGEFEQLAILEGHESEVKSLAWSPNGELLASCSRDRSIWLWGRESDDDEEYANDENRAFECVDMLSSAHSQDVKSVAFHPSDSALLASCGYDDIVCIHREDAVGSGQWNTEHSLSGHTSTVWSVAFAPEQDENPTTRLASSSGDGSVRLWKQITENGQKSFGLEAVLRVEGSADVRENQSMESASLTYTPDPSPVYDISWSPNGRLLATVSGGCDRSLRIFSVSPTPSCLESHSVFSSAPLVSHSFKLDPNCVEFMPPRHEDELVLAVTTDSPDVMIYQLVDVNWGELF